MADSLAEEILTEVAQNFFGKRRLVEKRIQLLHEYASELHKISRRLDQQIRLLHFLLIDQKKMLEFYHKIGVTQPPNQLQPEFDSRLIPIILPISFTARQKYVQLVLAVYKNVHKSCHEYMYGNHPGDAFAPDYKLFKKMCDLVNKGIKQLNEDASPTTVIQYMKQFDVIGAHKEHIAGAHINRERHGLTGKLAFKSVDIDSFKVKTYPDFPSPGQVGTEIKSFCKHNYRAVKKDVRQILRRIKKP
jgi:hypothetical protein